MRKARRATEPQVQLSGTKTDLEAVGVGHSFRYRDLSIGKLLAACFVTIIVLIIVADAVAVWQFRRMEASSERVTKADQALRAVVRVHIDIGTFTDRVAVMANSQDTREFAKDTASLKQKFLDDVDRARRILIASPQLDQNGTISSALETLRIALPAQLDTEVELANAGDWTAVRLRLAHQIQDLRELSLSQLEKVDQQLTQAESAALETTREARRKLFIVVPMAALVTLLAVAVLGWYLTRSITVPLSELASGAEALARGDFRQSVNVGRNDELAVVARAFNHAARQLQELYEELQEQASLLSLTHDSVYVRDMNGVIRYWNRGAEALYGWPAEHAVGEVAHQLLKTVSPLPLEQIETELLRSGSWEGELLKTKRDGTQIVVASRWALKRDERGAPIAALVTSNDITERKRAEETARRSARELRDVIEAVPAMVWSSLPDGSVDFINHRWQEFTGLPADDALGWNWEAAVHPDDRDRFVADWRAALAGGQPMETEVRVRAANGEYRWLFVRNVPVRDERGKIVKWYGASVDIDERKRAEETIRQSEKQLRDVIQTMPSIAWTNRPDGSIEFVNKRWQEYTGMSAEQSIGFGWHDVLHPNDVDRYLEKRKASLAAGDLFEDELRIRSGRIGEYRWFISRAVPLRDERGNIIRWYGTATDIHDRKRAEERLQGENVVLREEIDKASMFEEIVGTSPALQTVLSGVSKVARTDSTVLITGETGTGKELIARAIHRKSARSARPFISVNCAAIPQSLIASELFGHEKGAFTGALQRRLGRFELAEGGTIFLDEIGELPMETQIALLRVLQEREIQRVGGGQSIRVDLRILTATNRDLEKAIAAGTFREDLFYRLNVFPVHVPTLRERKEDIPMLVEYFIDRFARKAGKNIRSVDRESLELLESYSWPGNIRELQNVIERSVVICDSETLTIDSSWLSLGKSPQAFRAGSMATTIQAQEREFIEKALAETEGKVSGPLGAAAKLGISPSALEYKIRLLKINKHQFKKYLRE
jgi:formate hydrogenlyase transcriptional activator